MSVASECRVRVEREGPVRVEARRHEDTGAHGLSPVGVDAEVQLHAPCPLQGSALLHLAVILVVRADVDLREEAPRVLELHAREDAGAPPRVEEIQRNSVLAAAERRSLGERRGDRR